MSKPTLQNEQTGLLPAQLGDQGEQLNYGENAVVQQVCDEPCLYEAPLRTDKTINDEADEYETVSHHVSDTPGTVSFGGAIGNLILSVLGAGQLSLPYAFSELGLVGGTISLVLFAVAGLHSLSCLGEAAAAPGKGGSYAELTERNLGRKVRRLLDFFQWIYSWGGGVAFMIILKQEGGYLLTKMGVPLGEHNGQIMLAAISVCILWPLSSLDDLSKLKRISPLGCIAAVFITATVVATAQWGANGDIIGTCEGPAHGIPQPMGTLSMWPTSWGSAFAAFPLLSFALNSSWAYVPIIRTMKGKEDPTTRVKLTISAVSVILFNYLMFALPGYLTFCDKTDTNILQNLGEALKMENGWRGAMVFAARTALTVQLTLALPCRFQVARGVMVEMMYAGSTPPPSKKRDVLAACFLVLGACGLACTSLPLKIAIGLTSAIAASSIIYIMPALVDLRDRRGQLSNDIFRTVCSGVLIVMGLMILVAGSIFCFITA